MSEVADTLAGAVKGAVNDVLAASGGGMLTGFAVILNYIDVDGEPCWATCHADEQTPAWTLGMLRFHTLAIERETIAYLDRGRDE